MTRLSLCLNFTYFYPRPPRGGRLRFFELPVKFFDISIHALREEGDKTGGSADIAIGISIHALREEGDDGHQQTLPQKE